MFTHVHIRETCAVTGADLDTVDMADFDIIVYAESRNHHDYANCDIGFVSNAPTCGCPGDRWRTVWITD